MTALSVTDPADDASEWGERGSFWINFQTEPKTRSRKPRFLHQPLILSGHGLSLRIDRGSLLIRNGFTHHPQSREEMRYFAKDRRLPSRIVIVDGDGMVSLDALEWLSIQGVSLVQINWQGQITTTTGTHGYAADPTIMRAQLVLQDGPSTMTYARYLVDQKLRNAIQTLEQKFDPSDAADISLARLTRWLTQLNEKPPQTLHPLLVIEAHAAIAYFRCWRSMNLEWKGLGKKVIPDSWLQIGPRMTTEEGNQFAYHPIN